VLAQPRIGDEAEAKQSAVAVEELLRNGDTPYLLFEFAYTQNTTMSRSTLCGKLKALPYTYFYCIKALMAIPPTPFSLSFWQIQQIDFNKDHHIVGATMKTYLGLGLGVNTYIRIKFDYYSNLFDSAFVRVSILNPEPETQITNDENCKCPTLCLWLEIRK
jgi:hypothetical protein